VAVPSNSERLPRHGEAVRLLVASSNPGKLAELRALASGGPPEFAPEIPPNITIEMDLLPRFSELPPFDESAPTFAENAVGKALHYSRFADLPVIADDSGLVVGALGGAPGVRSARYAGPGASDAQRMAKLLGELRQHRVLDRSARFVCVIALAARGRVIGVFSDSVEGEILSKPRGAGGFGYDPVFFFDPLDKTFAEISPEEKNRYSHRGKAFRKLLEFLASSPML
jgi:XTP/dITP diphosphohydrolase